jgi:hypothetical protein
MVDKLSKMVHLAPTVTTVDAPSIADIFFNSVVRLHGMPSVIVSDRDGRFIAHFWRCLWSRLGTKLAMSSSFHPQTDGQTERANRVLEEMLRAYVDYHHDDWDKILLTAEIAINNAKHTSTGYSPYYLNYGQHPSFQFDVALTSSNSTPSVDNPTATERIEKLHIHWDQARKCLEQAQQQQSKYANQKRRDLQFKVGDKVLVSTEHLNLKELKQTRKLLSRYIGPYTITEVLSTVSYRVDLPPSIPVHPVFHVSKLQPYRDASDLFPTREVEFDRPPPELLVDGRDAWEVDKVLAMKTRRVGRSRKKVNYYLVLWKGYPEHEATWEPEKNLEQAKEAIKLFLQKQH